MWGIFDIILSVPLNIVMDLNNVMNKYYEVYAQVTQMTLAISTLKNIFPGILKCKPMTLAISMLIDIFLLYIKL